MHDARARQLFQLAPSKVRLQGVREKSLRLLKLLIRKAIVVHRTASATTPGLKKERKT